MDHVQRIVRSARIGGLKSEPPLSHVCWQLSSIERVAAGWMMTSATSHEAQDDALWHRARSANRSATSSDSELMILKTDCSVPSTVREDVRTQPTLAAATLDAVADRDDGREHVRIDSDSAVRHCRDAQSELLKQLSSRQPCRTRHSFAERFDACGRLSPPTTAASDSTGG